MELQKKKKEAKKKLTEATFVWREELLKLREQKTQIDLNKLAKRQEKASIIEKLEEQIDEERSESDEK